MCRREQVILFCLLALSLFVFCSPDAAPQSTNLEQLDSYLTQVNQELTAVSLLLQDQSKTIVALRSTLLTQATERAKERAALLAKLRSSENKATASLTELNTANDLLSVAKSSSEQLEKSLKEERALKEKESSLRKAWKTFALLEGAVILLCSLVFIFRKKIKSIASITSGILSLR